MCNTIGGKPVYVLTITDNVKEDDVKIDKPEVVADVPPSLRNPYGSNISADKPPVEVDELFAGQV